MTGQHEVTCVWEECLGQSAVRVEMPVEVAEGVGKEVQVETSLQFLGMPGRMRYLCWSVTGSRQQLEVKVILTT